MKNDTNEITLDGGDRERKGIFFIGDMYACNKKARNYYLDEMIQSFNFVFDEMCHGTGSAANCDFDVEE